MGGGKLEGKSDELETKSTVPAEKLFVLKEANPKLDANTVARKVLTLLGLDRSLGKTPPHHNVQM